MALEIIIGADIAPTENNIELFKKGDINTLIGNELETIINNADYSIFNLETPLTDIQNPIGKCGPNLIAPSSCIEGIKKINRHFFTLANNHILDQNEDGILNTIELLSKNNISYSGAGINLEEASKPYIYEKKGKKIGIYCCSEHEFCIAGKSSAGANPYDPLESFDHVEQLKQNCDFVIVLYHGGRELYRYPSPKTQKVFRKFADKGADLVIAQHTHCVGCEEIYNESRLVYGQGNFLFSYKNDEYWNNSLLIKLIINDDNYSIEYIPVITSEEGNSVRLAKSNKKETILKTFLQRSKEIKEDNFVNDNFTKYVQSQNPGYPKAIKGENGIFKRVYLKFFNRGYDFFYSKKRLYKLLNYLECETHNEIVITEIKRSLGLTEK